MKFMLFPELAQLSQALTHSSQECAVHTRIEAYSCKSVKKDKKLSKAMESNFADVKAEIKHSVGSPTNLLGTTTNHGSSSAAEDSQDEDALYASPFGPLNKSSSRKTLYHLIALLNLAFPDYDFSEAKPDHFCREVNGSSVLQALSATMYSVRTQSGPRLVYAPRSYATYPSTSPSIGSPLSRGVGGAGRYSPMYGSPSARSQHLSPPPAGLSLSPSSSPHQHHHNHQQPLSSGIHPTLFQVLDKVINLASCDVYSYTPDMDSDPHADDSDSDSDDSSSTDGDANDVDYYNDLLGFEDFGGGAADLTSTSPPKPKAITIINKSPYGRWGDDATDITDLPRSASPTKRLRGSAGPGGLLWSSHWFFYNKSMKRILFVTIWAKKRRAFSTRDEEEEEGAVVVDVAPDRFVGWDGALGAGARALGLKAKTM